MQAPPGNRPCSADASRGGGRRLRRGGAVLPRCARSGEELQIHGEEGEKVTILDVGRATLEISNPAQVDMIDRVEVGRRVSPHLRVAFEVVDAEVVTE